MFKIHKEGLQTLSLTAALLAITLLSADYWLNNQTINVCIFLVGTGLMFFLLQFFRNPDRNIVIQPNHILAPADGKIVVIEEVFEGEYLQAQAKQISIFMSPFNVHINRSPTHGIVTYYQYHAGKYLVAWHPKSSTLNERTTIGLQMNNGSFLVLRQIAGAVARRIKCYVAVGQPIVQGEEFGFIKFGSRVDIFIPLEAKVEVQLNQKVVGGITVLASLYQEKCDLLPIAFPLELLNL